MIPCVRLEYSRIAPQGNKKLSTGHPFGCRHNRVNPTSSPQNIICLFLIFLLPHKIEKGQGHQSSFSFASGLFSHYFCISFYTSDIIYYNIIINFKNIDVKSAKQANQYSNWFQAEIRRKADLERRRKMLKKRRKLGFIHINNKTINK